MATPVRLLTLCIVHQPPRVLLGMKKYGLGQGRWNGFGGKVERGESIEQAMVRETQEEAGITVYGATKRGIAQFSDATVQEILEVHIFHADQFTGTIAESAEMWPQWFDIMKIPIYAMWPADGLWLPFFLEDKKFRASFLCSFGEVLEHHITEVEVL